MKVEIWSDVVCPFCYIGKRRFERALEQFEYSDEIDVQWKSFQLNPDEETDPDANLTEHLAQSKGISVNQARAMQQRVVSMADGENLTFNFDQSVVANSFDAHRLLQFAKEHDKGSDAKEVLFHAYFTDGKNIDDREVLSDLAAEIGLESTKTVKILGGDQFANAIKHDIQIAKSMNVRGVPFFLFNRNFAISGARETSVFLKALKQSWNDWIEDDEGVPTVS